MGARSYEFSRPAYLDFAIAFPRAKVSAPALCDNFV